VRRGQRNDLRSARWKLAPNPKPATAVPAKNTASEVAEMPISVIPTPTSKAALPSSIPVRGTAGGQRIQFGGGHCDRQPGLIRLDPAE
jgi:hypothetical protein